MKKLIAALAAAVVLTGCVKMGNSPPPDLPPYVQLYPGATTVMTVTLTCDHRVVDGATGARWLQVFKTMIEQPAAMLV